AFTSTRCRPKRRLSGSGTAEAAHRRPPNENRVLSCRRSVLHGYRLLLLLPLQLAVAARRVDRSAEVQALVLGLLDQHHRLERVDVVDPLLLALRRNLRLVRPVVELHLRDTGDLADLAQVELHLVEVLSEIDGLEQVDLSTDCHWEPSFSG